MMTRCVLPQSWTMPSLVGNMRTRCARQQPVCSASENTVGAQTKMARRYQNGACRNEWNDDIWDAGAAGLNVVLSDLVLSDPSLV
jgi:hypothetical protein